MGFIFRWWEGGIVDNILGYNPYGCVFTEYSIHQENVWNLIRPILAFNGGWAIFNFTPRGTNHAYKLLELAKGNKNWFTQVLTVDDTKLLSKGFGRRTEPCPIICFNRSISENSSMELVSSSKE